jgi:hypothetical protein
VSRPITAAPEATTLHDHARWRYWASGEYRLTDDGQTVPCLEISLNVFRAIDFAEFLTAASKIGDLVDAENYQERGLASAIREAATVARRTP